MTLENRACGTPDSQSKVYGNNDAVTVLTLCQPCLKTLYVLFV